MLLALLVAAQITNVADAADEKHPLEVDLEATYTHLKADTTLARERTTAAGIARGDELSHTRILDGIDLRLAVGLWHDLEVHVVAPIAFHDVQRWTALAGGTLASNTIDVSGCGGGRCGATQPIGAVPGESRRAGFFDPTVGIAWSPINQDRVETPEPGAFPGGPPAATWTLGFDYTVPVGGAVSDPSGAAADGTGAEQRQAHVLTLWTAFSKRLGLLEPYLAVEGAAPFASGKAYDNCRHPERLSDVAPANCAGSWKGQTGYRPPYEAAFTAGSELVVSEDLRRDQRFSFDLRGAVRWHGPSRGYTQAADLLGKLTSADEYVTTTGQLAFYGRLARWFHLRVSGLLGVDSAHFLTHEDIGEDKNGDGAINVSQGTGVAAPDQNPDYDFRLDPIGRRLRAERSVFWGVSGTLSLNF